MLIAPTVPMRHDAGDGLCTSGFQACESDKSQDGAWCLATSTQAIEMQISSRCDDCIGGEEA